MDIRFIGPPDVVQAWAAKMREDFGVRTTLMTCRHTDQLRCYVRMDDRLAMVYVSKFEGQEHPVQRPRERKKR